MRDFKIICVVGPTSSGKSEFAVKLAKKFNGEIISVDSRQIYRGLNLGSGKVEGKWQPVFFERNKVKSRSKVKKSSPQGRRIFIYKSIPHYLIDEANPKRQYSVAQFQKKAQRIIKDILKRDKLPILCGGTMHWMDAVVYNQTLPAVKPNLKLRKQLEKLDIAQLFQRLQKLDAVRAQQIDNKNPRRLIRALEIIESTGKPVPISSSSFKGRAGVGSYKTIWLGLNPDPIVLEQKIKKRLNARFQKGMIKEVTALHKDGLSWKKLESFGLEYKFIAQFLQNKITESEMKEQLFISHRQYVKRQLTWWKRNLEIHWLKPDQKINLQKLL